MMNKFHVVKNLKFTKDRMTIIIDAKKYLFELHKISKILLNATEKERNHFEISPSGYGIHWPLLDEDLAIDGLLGILHKPDISIRESV